MKSLIYEKEHVIIRRAIRLKTVSANRRWPLAAGAYLNGDAYFINKKNAAVTVRIGTTDGGQEVLADTLVPALSTVAVPLLRSFDGNARSLYINSSSWNGASLGVVMEYTEVPGGTGVSSGGGGPIVEPPVPTTLQIVPNARFLALGDSITSESSTKGFRNSVVVAQFLYKGYFRPCVSQDQGKGGDTLTQMLARIGFTTGQKPDVVRLMGGHNDGMSTALQTLKDRHDAITNAIWTDNPNCIIILMPKLPSTVESTQALNDTRDAFNAYIASKQNLVQSSQRRAIYVPVPANWDRTAVTGDTMDGIHTNLSGALKVAKQEVATVSPFMIAYNALTDTTAKSWASENYDVEYLLAGTGGGKTLVNGDVADGKQLINSTSLTPVASKFALAQGSAQRFSISGTPSATAVITWQEATSSNVGFTPNLPIGQYVEYLLGVKLTGADFTGNPLGIYGIGSTAASLGNAANASEDASWNGYLNEAMEGVLRTRPNSLRASSGAISPSFAIRVPAAPVAFGVELQKPIVRKIELDAYARPMYVGNDTINGSSEQLTISGTATLTANIGKYSGGALVYNPQWYRDGVAIAGATNWTYVYVSSTDANKAITFGSNPTNSFGAENVPARSNAITQTT